METIYGFQSSRPVWGAEKYLQKMIANMFHTVAKKTYKDMSVKYEKSGLTEQDFIFSPYLILSNLILK